MGVWLVKAGQGNKARLKEWTWNQPESGSGAGLITQVRSDCVLGLSSRHARRGPKLCDGCAQVRHVHDGHEDAR